VSGAHARDIFGLADLPSGGTARHLAVFALGLLPYVTAAVLVQFAAMVSSRLRALRGAGERGRVKIAAYTLYLTILLAAFQSYGLAQAIERVQGLVAQPGLIFELTTMFTLTAGTVLLVWLSNQITARGVGNGLVLFLAIGLLVEFPANIAFALERARQGYISFDIIGVAAVLAAAVTVLIVLVESARRRIPVVYPARNIGGVTVEGRTAELSLKLNNAGIIPTVLAGWCIFLPVVALNYALGPGPHPILAQFQHGRPLFMLVYFLLILLLSLFYTAFLIDPEEAGDTLDRHGGALPGVAPGERTAGYIDSVLSRITLVGAIYLALLFILPELLIVYLGVPFYLGGVSLLVVVCAIMDIGAQIRQDTQARLGGYR
jgi:preprotein translocase subunit SecY